MNDIVDMVALFRAELDLCKVGSGQVLAVLSEGDTRADYAQAFLIAARDLGATAFQVNLPARRQPRLETNRPAIEALKRAHMVVDLVKLLFSSEQNELMAAGVRVLMVVEPLAVLKQMFPTPDLRRRVEAAGERLARAKELRVTSAAGTDIRYGLSQYPVLTEYGYTDTPGRWDHWPSGFVLTQGNDRDVEGTVVLAPGDIVAAFRKYVQSPVRLTVKRGAVTDIAGELDAELLRSFMQSFNDERAYAVAHIGWGLNEKAHWHNQASTRELDRELGMHSLAFYGNVLFSLGPNTEVGGTNDTLCHVDLPLRNCSLKLDGETIVDDGRVVPATMRAPGR